MPTTTTSTIQIDEELECLFAGAATAGLDAAGSDCAGSELTNPDDESADAAGALDAAPTELRPGERLAGADVARRVGLVLVDGFGVGVGLGFLTTTVGVGEGGGGGEAARAAAGSATSYTALCTPSLPTITERPSRVKAIASSWCCSGIGNACSVPFTPTAQ